MRPATFAFRFVVDVILGTVCFLSLYFAAFVVGFVVHWTAECGMNSGMVIAGQAVEWIILAGDTVVFLLWFVNMTWHGIRELWQSLRGSSHGAAKSDA